MSASRKGAWRLGQSIHSCAFDASHPCIRSRIKSVGGHLGARPRYRYREPDGFDGDEATFTACAFWKVGCLALRGDLDEAKAAFERLLARANDVGLYAEEIDAATGEQRGNLPQGFTHMAVINHAVRLGQVAARLEDSA